MNTTLSDQIIENMRQKPTEELLAIWTSNDREQWSDAAFEAISQILSERGVIVAQQEVLAPPPPRYRGVRGWLLLFCLNLTVISPLVTLAQLRATFESERTLFDLHPGLRLMGLLDIALTGFGVYAGVCLWRVTPGAVKKAKVLLWCRLAYLVAIPTVILLFMSGLPVTRATIAELIREVVPPVVPFVIWMAYLDVSKRVRGTYGV